MEKPIVYKLPETKDDIFTVKPDIQFLKAPIEPQFKNGFNFRIHMTKDKMEATIGMKKQVYLVANPFEHKITKHDSMLTYSDSYFGIKKEVKPDILSRAFYKMWEMIVLFDLVPHDDPKFTSAHIAEGPGAFIQAVAYYRDKFEQKNVVKNDKYFGVTLKSDEKYVPDMAQKFIKYYGKRFILHKTDNNDIGDVTEQVTINNFEKLVKKSGKKADLVTADGGFRWTNENYQEQEAFLLVLGEIITGIKVQEQGGSFVLKLFESYTDITIKMIAVLNSFYKEIYIVKPLTSRSSNSEKYVVCKQFRKNDKNVKILEEILNKMKNSEDYLSHFFKNFNIPKEMRNVVIKSNEHIANNQMTMINKIVKYIDVGNFFGDVYHKYIDDQIKANKYWINTFFQNDVKQFKKVRIAL